MHSQQFGCASSTVDGLTEYASEGYQVVIIVCQSHVDKERDHPGSSVKLINSQDN